MARAGRPEPGGQQLEADWRFPGDAGRVIGQVNVGGLPGGRLWAAPNPDHGMTFHFSLPLAQNNEV